MAELKAMRDLTRAKYGRVKVLESQLLGDEFFKRGFARTSWSSMAEFRRGDCSRLWGTYGTGRKRT